jgi:hypothetical protein
MADQPQSPESYVAVLADLEAKRQQLDNAIAILKSVMGQQGTEAPLPSGGPSASSGPAAGGAAARPGDFLGMSIPEATKKYLTIVRRKISTRDLMKALVDGGLLPPTYNTVYAVLRRRQAQVGDITNMGGDWALAEWYPNRPKKTEPATKGKAKARAKAKAKTKEPPNKEKEPPKEKETHKEPKDPGNAATG